MSKNLKYLQHLDYKDVTKAFGWEPLILQRDLADFLQVKEESLSQMSKSVKSRKKRLLMMLGLRLAIEKGIIQLDNKKRGNNADVCNSRGDFGNN